MPEPGRRALFAILVAASWQPVPASSGVWTARGLKAWHKIRDNKTLTSVANGDGSDSGDTFAIILSNGDLDRRSIPQKSVIQFHYNLSYYPDGQRIYSTVHPVMQTPQVADLGDYYYIEKDPYLRPMLNGIWKAFQTLEVAYGDKWRLWISPQDGYGPDGYDGVYKVLPHAMMTCDFVVEHIDGVKRLHEDIHPGDWFAGDL
eukprot:gnl/TRDRNA2_/TRDRNA2_198235_c0_seq1.p1 gnl/TRDRNA2_/TRDRNA2_198235_c0~~gnl/TRDRNA2_/TRDRNA2_198235_c0_seq1.p1  ORF type:complete len:202 (-),score=23.10 gnl/TRDRNA2_/TRDRNA2_198235_c0_seq1:91-696(-)